MSNKAEEMTMKQDAEPTLKPRLRFPEFRDAEGWDADGLSNVANFVSERIPLETIGVVNYVSTENILPDFSGVTTASKLPTTGSATRFRVNDILVSNIRPYLKKVWVSDKDGGASNDVIVIRAKKNLSSQYLPFILKNDSFIAYVMRGAKGVKMPRGDVSLMREYPVVYPSIPEQQKIADCLINLDELIAAHDHKLDALKAHKQGLMEQLFPREGETVPRLRFPNFQNGSDWDAQLISDVVKSVKTGKLDANAMVDNGKYRFYTCAKNYYKIDNYAFDGEALLIAGNGAYLGYIHHYIGKFNAYQRTYVLQEFDINVIFLKYYLDRNFPARLSSEKKDGNTPYIVLSSITDMPLLVPRDEDEQREIADCLSSLDELVSSQTQKLDALKAHKKALMQQLFPSMAEEVEA
jgi:type I restriction enzyme, S subunit